jgi:thiamine-phosphate pyrophosphorylase
LKNNRTVLFLGDACLVFSKAHLWEFNLINMFLQYRMFRIIMYSNLLYLISPPQINLLAFCKELELALVDATKGFVGSFQLRLKDADDETIKRAIHQLMPICRAHEVAFIINDRADLCAELMCDGVHIGQEDLEKTSMRAIRNIVGEQAVIGVTCHASRHLAMEAGAAGADYVAFGAFYPTTSKPTEKLEKWGIPTPEILEWWQAYMTLPCVAIGGITPGNCKPLADAGADFIAVINAVWNHAQGAAVAIKEFEKELL